MSVSFDLTGKKALVTGANTGLGQAIAIGLAQAGADIVAVGRSKPTSTGEAVVALGRRFTAVAANLGSTAPIPAIIDQAGPVDILVNNAGITQPLKIMEIAPENYDAVTDVNLRGTLYMTQALIPHWRARQTGSVVNMSSVSAQRGGGIFGGPHYSAAKAGVLGLTKAMARELAPDGVRVNAICPGFIATDITAGKLTDEMRAQVLAGIPMGRAGEASDVAGCALFLASELSSYVTGSEVDVNGGSLIH